MGFQSTCPTFVSSRLPQRSRASAQSRRVSVGARSDRARTPVAVTTPAFSSSCTYSVRLSRKRWESHSRNCSVTRGDCRRTHIVAVDISYGLHSPAASEASCARTAAPRPSSRLARNPKKRIRTKPFGSTCKKNRRRNSVALTVISRASLSCAGPSTERRPGNESRPRRKTRRRLAINFPRKTRLSAFTGKNNGSRGCTQCVRSDESPPTGITQCTCGWCRRFWPQV